MTIRVREAALDDLNVIVDFIIEEAKEAERRTLDRETLEAGIAAGLRDDSTRAYQKAGFGRLPYSIMSRPV